MHIRSLSGALVLLLAAGTTTAPLARAEAPSSVPLDWVRAGQGVQAYVVMAINDWMATYDAPPRAVDCFNVSVLSQNRKLALAAFPESVDLSCDPSDGFGEVVFKKVNGKWRLAAQISGGQGSHCDYYVRLSAAEKALLTRLGPC